MSEDIVIARPYAKAAFDQAVAKNSLAKWREAVELLGLIAADANVVSLIKDPRIDDAKVSEMMLDICQEKISVEKDIENFIKLLAENHRLTLIPKIAELFEELRAEHEKTVDVNVISSHPFSDAQKQSLTQALERKFERKVSMHFNQDESLIGGAVIRVGDYVIDGSVKGKLSRLSNYLNL